MCKQMVNYWLAKQEPSGPRGYSLLALQKDKTTMWDGVHNNLALKHMRGIKKGDQITAVVLSVDPERERISLGIKQAQEDPFNAYVGAHSKGASVKGVITSVDAKGAVVELGEGVEGYLRATELSREYVEDARSVLNPGSDLEAKITSIDRKTRRITLSIKALEAEIEDKAVQQYSGQVSAKTSLGEKLKEEFEKQDT